MLFGSSMSEKVVHEHMRQELLLLSTNFSRIEMIVLKDEYGSVYVMHLIKNILYHGEEDEFVVVKMATRMCIFKPRALEKDHYRHRYQGIHNSINGPLPQSLRLELLKDEKCFLPTWKGCNYERQVLG